jgi:hypothetical protein
VQVAGDVKGGFAPQFKGTPESGVIIANNFEFGSFHVIVTVRSYTVVRVKKSLFYGSMPEITVVDDENLMVKSITINVKLVVIVLTAIKLNDNKLLLTKLII